MRQNPKIYESKIIVMGPVGVGKTTAILGLCNKKTSIRSTDIGDEVKTPRSTTFIDILTRDVIMQKKNSTFVHKLTFWDTCGMERFHSLSMRFFREATHIICVVDITKPFPTKYIEMAIERAKNVANISNNCIIMVGNKTDLKKNKNCVTDMISFSNMNGIKTAFCSAKTLHNMDKVLTYIIQISEKMRSILNRGSIIIRDVNYITDDKSSKKSHNEDNASKCINIC